MFGSVETSHTASSKQRMNEASEGMISSRCLYSLRPHSFLSLHLCYLSLFPLAPLLSTPSHQLLFQVLTLSYLRSGPHPLWKSSCYPGILLLTTVGLLPCCQKCMSNVSVYSLLFKSACFRFSASSHLQWESLSDFGRRPLQIVVVRSGFIVGKYAMVINFILK